MPRAGKHKTNIKSSQQPCLRKTAVVRFGFLNSIIMAKEIILKITQAQLLAIVDITDTLSSMFGTVDVDFNKEGQKQVRLIDRML